jgi:cell division protein FtsB
LQACARHWKPDRPVFQEISMTNTNGLDTALADLRRKAAKRRETAGYAANVAVLEARIAALEAQRAAALAQDEAG